MKKLLTLILALALILPAAALAEERDPIVGPWYMFVDTDTYPEQKSFLPIAGKLISIYFFDADNIIRASETTIAGEETSSRYIFQGKWEKTSDGYNVSLPGLGTNPSFIDGDCLMVGAGTAVNGITVYMRLRRMHHFDPFTDYTYQGGNP